jgi:predicted GNAT family N-acyltransferase
LRAKVNIKWKTSLFEQKIIGMVEIRPIGFGTPEFDEALALRYAVLRRPLGLEYDPEQIALEWSQEHLAAYDRMGQLIGYLNLTPAEGGAVKMRQVAIDPAWQGKGVGRLLVEASERHATQLGYAQMVLHARESAVPFYDKLGYQRVGERFEEVGIPHFRMEKKL